MARASARDERDNKATLCQDLWNASHPHIIVVTKDAEACKNFYKELQKNLTEIMKRLLGLEYLHLWEGRPMAAEIADLAKAKERMAYLYANPAQNDLVDSIEKFPGYSSWKDFLRCSDRLDAETTETFPWVRLPSIPALPSPQLSLAQDSNLVRMLTKANRKKKHDLIRQPNAWMKCFGIKTIAAAKEVLPA